MDRKKVLDRRRWTDNDLIRAVKNSKSKLQVIKKLGLTVPGSYRTVNKYIRLLNIKLDHFETNSERGKRIGKHKRLKNKDVFKIDSDYDSVGLKRRIIRDNLLPYICQLCNLTDTWNSLPLILQLDHISGKNRDNRLKNLRFLCPNCHTQTNTFCRRKIKLIPKQRKLCSDCEIVTVRNFTVTGLCRSCSAKRRHRWRQVRELNSRPKA